MKIKKFFSKNHIIWKIALYSFIAMALGLLALMAYSLTAYVCTNNMHYINDLHDFIFSSTLVILGIGAAIGVILATKSEKKTS